MWRKTGLWIPGTCSVLHLPGAVHILIHLLGTGCIIPPLREAGACVGIPAPRGAIIIGEWAFPVPGINIKGNSVNRLGIRQMPHKSGWHKAKTT